MRSVSSIGIRSGLSKRLAVEERMNLCTPCSTALSSRFSPLMTLFADVEKRLLHRLADQRVRGEVHDGIRACAVPAPRRPRRGRPGRPGQTPPSDGLPAVALVQVVEDDDLLAGLDQLFDDDAADVAGAAGDENFHLSASLS